MAAPEQLNLRTEAITHEAGNAAHWMRETGIVLAAVALVAVCAQLAVPIPGTPVPVTLQDLAVFAAGIALGPRRGALSIASYIVIGAMGAPVFSNGHGGMPWLMGPTGGFLLSFPLAAFVMGAASRPGKVWALLLGVVAAQVVMFACGLAQLALITRSDLGTAVAQGLLPFLPGVAFKSVLLVIFGTALASYRRPDSASAG